MFCDLAKFLYVSYKDQMDQQRAVSYLGGRSNMTASFMSQGQDDVPSELQIDDDISI